MTDSPAERLRAQIESLQGVELTPERAEAIAGIVDDLVAPVAERGAELPFDSDVPMYHAALHRHARARDER